MANIKWGNNAELFLATRSYINEEGCHLWSGYLDKGGYALIESYKCAKPYKVSFAHQLAYILAHGDYDRLHFRVCHKCDVRSCVNAEHLFLGTMKDNMQDKMEKGRHRCPAGSSQWKAKLVEKDIIIIRAMLRHGYKGIDLAKYYRVCPQTISLINKDKIWRNVC